MASAVPAFADIEAAARRVAGQAYRTPVLESAVLNERTGRRVLIKPECLQRTGSFKFRGAYNRISQLDPAQNPAGVVAYSSGNHAQGVAAAARLCGLPAVIVMPADTPAIKRRNTEAQGGRVVTYDRAREDREAISRGIAQASGAVLVPPYEDADIIAGQGTAGLEFARDLAQRGIGLDALICGVSGGGLIAGIGLAFAALSPETRLYCAEPQGFDDHARSLVSGKRERNAGTTGSICDALLAPEPGELTFSINRRQLAGGLSVSDPEVRRAVRFAFEHLKLVVEPGGAVALAAVLEGKARGFGSTIGVIISGGNVDATAYRDLVAA